MKRSSIAARSEAALREAGSDWRTWVLGGALVLAGIAAWWPGNPFARASRDAVLDSARRLDGDIMVLSSDTPPVDIGEVRDLAARSEGVIDVAIMAVWEVQIETAAMSSSALLELRGLHDTRAALPVFRGSTPAALSSERPPELAIGHTLAERLRVSVGDSVTVRVARGAGTTGVARKVCKVVAIAQLGLDHFDQRVLLADISQLSNFALIPTGVSVQLSAPEKRAIFARDLQRRLSSRWRAIPLEELIAPLLRSGS